MENNNIPPETPERHEPTEVFQTPQTVPLPQNVPATQPKPVEASPGHPVNPEEKSFATRDLSSMFDSVTDNKYYKKYLKYKKKYLALQAKASF